jgi:dTDP-4-amino-4,6-dideoxygalactose transaminase
VVTSDALLASRLRSLRDHGRSGGSHYNHAHVGMNSRLDALQAAVLSAKLSFLDGWNDARRRVTERYRVAYAAAGLPLVDEDPFARGVYHLAVVRVPRRDRARRLFESLGIATAVHYPTPIHHMPTYRSFATGRLPVAEQAAAEVLSLPMFPHLSDQQVDRVCDAAAVVAELLETDEAINA